MNNILEIVALCVCAVAGVIFCFLGNRWRRVAAAIYGAALGFLLGHILLPIFFPSLGNTEVLLCSAGAGVVFGLLFALWIYLGIFMIGFGGGALLCMLVVYLCNLPIWEWYVYVPAVIICSVIGALTLNIKRIFLSIFTSFIGAVLIALAINQVVVGGAFKIIRFFTTLSVLQEVFSSTVFLIALGAAFVVGLVIQLAVTARKKN
jgi:hypothetical protein